LDSSYFIGEPQDRQYVRENPELESGQRTNDAEAEAFEELIGKVGQELKKTFAQGRRSNSDPITLIETESAGNINLKAKAGS